REPRLSRKRIPVFITTAYSPSSMSSRLRIRSTLTIVEWWMRQNGPDCNSRSKAARQHVRVGSNVQTGVIVRGLDPVDLGNANEHDLPCVLDDERLCGAWSPLPVMTHSLFGSRVTVRLRVTTPTRPVPRRRGTPIQLCGPSLIEQMTSAPTTHPGLTFRSIT